jgi:hypothetical protein
MLKGLKDIDWGRLTHAFGSASDVLTLIRALATADSANCEGVIDALWSRICHQRTIYEATGPAVPFLLELLACEDVAYRAGILRLLADIRNGTGEMSLGLSAQVSKWVEESHTAVDAGYDQYVALTNDPDDATRSMAMRTMVAVKSRTSESALHLRRMVDSSNNQRAREAALVALSRMSSSPPISLSALITIVQSGDPDYVRVAAASTLAKIAGAATPPDVIDLLCGVILGQVSYRRGYDRPDIPEALRATGASGAEQATPLLLHGLASAPVAQKNEILWIVMSLHFGRKSVALPSVPELNTSQRQVLEMLVFIPSLWYADANIRGILAHYGLPATRDDLRILLGLGADDWFTDLSTDC